MRGFERLVGARVVADPAAIDGAAWRGKGPIIVLRLAPDDAFGAGAEGVDVDDPHAIVVRDDGFVGRRYLADEFEREVRPHVEWPLPAGQDDLVGTTPDHARGASTDLLQGAVAGVPAKVRFLDEGSPGRRDVLLMTWAAYADELAERLRVP